MNNTEPIRRQQDYLGADMSSAGDRFSTKDDEAIAKPPLYMAISPYKDIYDLFD